MAGAYTISPVYNEETGAVVDFDVDSGYDGYRSSDRDFVELSDGSTHHVFENVEIDESGQEDYLTLLANSDSRIPSALQWASTNLSPDIIAEYNEAVDNNDIDTINRTLEYILNEYPSDDGDEFQEYEEQDEDVELSEQDQAVIDAISEQLSQQEPLGVDVADEWDSVAQQAQASGNDVYAAVCQATASYHSGTLTSEAAIRFVLDNYPLKQVAAVYQQLIQE